MTIEFNQIVYFTSLIFVAGGAWVKINILKDEIAKIKSEHLRPIYKEIDDLKEVKASVKMVQELKNDFHRWMDDLKEGQKTIHVELREILLIVGKRKTDQ